jgi:hypothetical protein
MRQPLSSGWNNPVVTVTTKQYPRNSTPSFNKTLFRRKKRGGLLEPALGGRPFVGRYLIRFGENRS